MGDFFRSAYGLDVEQGFTQGAGRLLIAPYNGGTDYPAGLEDILVLPSGATQYDVVAPWVEAGYTKSGINITRNNSEEEYDVDQVQGAIRRRPTNWEMSVGTQLAESTLETFQTAWEAGGITAVSKTAPQLAERHLGLNAPTNYPQRMVAVVFLYPDGILRAYVFAKCEHAAQESGFTLNKTGEQVSLPTRFNCLADTTRPAGSVFGEIMEQVAA